MSETAGSIDATQVAGVLAFAAAALACVRAASTRPGVTWLWRIIAAVNVVLLLEAVLGSRYDLHRVASGILQERGWYASRPQWQGALLILFIAVAATATAWACWHQRRDRGAAWAIGGLALALSVFGTETISVHAIDAWLYAPVGPIRAIGWLWLGAVAVVIRGALAPAPPDPRHRSAPRPGIRRPGIHRPM